MSADAFTPMPYKRGPSTLVNSLDREVMGVPARWVLHIDLDQSILADHEYEALACASCDYCGAFRGKP